MNKISDYLYVCKNIIDSELCDSIIDHHLMLNNWHEHSYTSYNTSKIKNKKEILNAYLSENFAEKYNYVLQKALYAYLERYSKLTNLPSPIVERITTPRINRYIEGTKMDLHFDNITSLFAENVGSPILTVLGCLNDRAEYMGGEFYIFGDLLLECDKGDVIIFPSAFMFPHEVKVVTKGERWSTVSWTV